MKNNITLLFRSFLNACSGLKFAFSTQRNFRIHFFSLVLVIAAGFLYKINLWEWLIILGCSCVVISAELFNTAIEALCDKLHPEKDSQIGKVKDISAAAVLAAALFALLAGILIFGNKILP